MRRDYHSAHYPERDATPRDHYYCLRGVAIVHDLTDGPLPQRIYDGCDVFYTDPPWRSEYDEFAMCVGTIAPPYEAFMDALVASIPDGIPAAVVTGKHAARWFQDGWSIYPVRLNEHDALAYTRGIDVQPWAKAADLGRQLAATYQKVADPCCGYGNTVRWFVEAGKKFAASDVNPRCIGYIAEHEKRWANVQPK